MALPKFEIVSESSFRDFISKIQLYLIRVKRETREPNVPPELEYLIQRFEQIKSNPNKDLRYLISLNEFGMRLNEMDFFDFYERLKEWDEKLFQLEWNKNKIGYLELREFLLAIENVLNTEG